MRSATISAMLRNILLAFALVLPAACAADDVAKFGAVEDQLFWDFEQKVAGFRNMDKITWTRTVPAGDVAFPLPNAKTRLGNIEFMFDGQTWTADDYVERQQVAGLIVVKDGSIVYERYELGNAEDTRWISYSVAKSVTSLLVGAALQDGYIDSIDEKISSYLPKFADSAYGQTSIRNAMQMASGVEWNEDYKDPESDINKTPWSTLGATEYLRGKSRVAEAGEVFNYNTAETGIVGNVVRSAIGNNLSTYLSEKIWKPFGMEHDGYWVLSEPGGGEFGGSSLNASLRDYARLGLFALHDGELPDGSRTLPEGWMAESTEPSQGHAGYGYLWWLREGGVYAASGIFGQGIHIDPANNVVIAMHSARDGASNRDAWALQGAFFDALAEAASH